MKQAHILENINAGKILFVHFYELFFTLDTICVDKKEKPVA